jgi:hypothetical protein
MKPSLTDTLCTRCGLCCDGSLFADVELANGDEASALEVMGLEIEDADEDDSGLLVQPCGALQGNDAAFIRIARIVAGRLRVGCYRGSSAVWWGLSGPTRRSRRR